METRMKSIQKKRILMSPLNWGHGHVTRTVPLIKQLVEQGNEVIIFCDADQKKVYLDFFAQLTFVHSAGYPFHFSGKGKWSWDLLLGFLKLNKRRVRERKEVLDWVEHYHPDIIISDQRYGFYHKRIKSVFISHQLTLPVKGLNRLAQILNYYFIKQFDEVWVPDAERSRLSGKLSSRSASQKFYLGIHSRFKQSTTEIRPKKYLAIISGPAPYGTQFYNMVFDKLSQVAGSHTIVVPENVVMTKEAIPNIELIQAPNPELFQYLLDQSEVIISRAGYTTLLDLDVTGHRAILIPTKGQPEQLYLAKFHASHPKWKFMTEEQFQSTSL